MTDDNLPAKDDEQVYLPMPVVNFEGEMVRLMMGKLPALTLEMDSGFPRGERLKLELEVRVRSVSVDEARGKHKGDLVRTHSFALESARIILNEDEEEGVGGGLAANGHDIEDDTEDDDASQSQAWLESQEGENEREERDEDPGF